MKPDNLKPVLKEYDSSTTEVTHSGCCVAASIEYNLASQMPAEFARVAEGLSSEKMASTKTIDLKNLCENQDDAKWLLDNFKIPSSPINFLERSVQSHSILKVVLF